MTLTIALAGAAILLLALGGTLAIVLYARAGLGQLAGQIGAVSGSICGLVAALRVLVTGNAVSLTGIWHMPGGGFHFEIDFLSAFFLLPVFGLSIVTGLYGRSYFAGHGGIASAASWFHLNMLTVSMALVIAAQDGLLFLLAWEVMALSPFFLVIFDDRKAAVRHAAWTYLVAAHLGTAFLLVLFVLLGSIAASSDFAAYGAALKDHQALRSAVFLLALIGFGVKAGIVPAHVWLPEAHPVAPSHASALMSGAMIKVGIYGLVRILTLLGTPETWWGWLLIGVGASSGVLGVLFALAQHDLKRLLAYHSVENIGIILLGIGTGVLGLASGMPLLAIWFAPAFSTFSITAFQRLCLGGAVARAAHTLELEELGGLLKRMPWTGTFFLIGAAAIVGLPPLNGFVSEFLLLYAGFLAVLQPAAAVAVAGLIVLVILGLIGGLAAACFAKAFGIVFLGSPRSAEASEAREVARPMRASMAVLALLCIAIGLGAPLAVASLAGVVAQMTGATVATASAQLAIVTRPLALAVSVFVFLIAVAALAWALRARRLAVASVRRGPVWGCGYLFPSPKMQYTASSFAQPLTTQFHLLIQNREAFVPPQGYFPAASSYASDSGDPALHLLFVPTFRWFDRVVTRLNVIQHGHIHVYILYVAATLIALLIWESL